MQLSDHFSLKEFTYSDTAIRLDIDNTPDQNVFINLNILAEGLETVRTKLDGNAIRVSSGYRSLILNRALHSKDTSQHILGLACDFACPGFGNVNDVMRTLSQSGIEFQQLILEFNSWIHISFPPAGQIAKREILLIDKQGTRFYR